MILLVLLLWIEIDVGYVGHGFAHECIPTLMRMWVGENFFMIGIDRAHRVVSGISVGMVAESKETNRCMFFNGLFEYLYGQGRIFPGIFFLNR